MVYGSVRFYATANTCRESVIHLSIYWLKWMSSFSPLAVATGPDWDSTAEHDYCMITIIAGAKLVIDDYDGIVPTTVDELMKIEGIRWYMASGMTSSNQLIAQSLPIRGDTIIAKVSASLKRGATSASKAMLAMRFEDLI